MKIQQKEIDPREESPSEIARKQIHPGEKRKVTDILKHFNIFLSRIKITEYKKYIVFLLTLFRQLGAINKRITIHL